MRILVDASPVTKASDTAMPALPGLSPAGAIIPWLVGQGGYGVSDAVAALPKSETGATRARADRV